MAKEITTQINHLIDLGMSAQQIVDESGIHPLDLRIDLLIHKAWVAKNNVIHSEESYAQNVRVLAAFDKWYTAKAEELEVAVVNEEAPIETPAQEETTMNQVERNAAIYQGEIAEEFTYTPAPQATFTKAIHEHGGEIIITESDIDTRIDWSRTPINLDGETVVITHMAGHHIENGIRYAAFRYARITNPDYFTKPNRYAAAADRHGADYGINGGIWDDM